MDAVEARRPAILGLAAPLVISFWIRGSFTLVDTIFAAGIGETTVAALALTVPYEFALIACWVGASNGFTSRLSAAMGAREGQRIEQLHRATRRIILGLCFLFTGLAAWIWFQACPEGRDPEVHLQFRRYASVLLVGSAFTSFWSILPDSIVKAHQDMRSTMWAGLISGTVNVVLNAIFVFVFHWGVFGIAFSTVLGRIGGLVYATGRARFHEEARLARGRDDRPGLDASPVLSIARLAVPAALGFLLMAVESKAILTLLEGCDDEGHALAAWGIYDQAVRFMALPLIACGVAMLPLAGRLWGQGRSQDVRREIRAALLAGLVFLVLFVTPVCWFAAGPIAAALTENAATREMTALGIRWIPLAVLAAGPTFPLRSAFEGMQRPRPGLTVSILRTFVLVVPLAWLGLKLASNADLHPIAGAYGGSIVGVGLSSVILAIWMASFLRGEGRRGNRDHDG